MISSPNIQTINITLPVASPYPLSSQIPASELHDYVSLYEHLSCSLSADPPKPLDQLPLLSISDTFTPEAVSAKSTVSTTLFHAPWMIMGVNKLRERT